MRFSKKVVVFMFTTIFIFTGVMIWAYLQTGGVPDTLIDRFFAFFGLEGGALGVIKVAETWAAAKTDKAKKTKERKQTK